MQKEHHVLILPDGHRRYAQSHDISYMESYLRCAHKFMDIVAWSFEEHPIGELSIGVLAEYNFKREEQEVHAMVEASLAFIEQLSLAPVVKKHNLQLQPIGEMEQFYAAPGTKRRISKALQRFGDGKKVNLLLAYNADKELQRAWDACLLDEVNPTFAELSKRWCIPPVDLSIRTGMPDGFNNLSAYVPGIERARLISIPEYPQDFTREAYNKIITDYLNLKDSVKKATRT
jgi:undecaprenyl diphosphate synthase